MYMPRIDLHGYTVWEGWKFFRSSTRDSYYKGYKNIVVIVGHGEMSKEFAGWCDADPFVKEARRFEKNAGAWRVIIKKKLDK